MVSRSKQIDFKADARGWTPDQYILTFWHYAQGYAINKYLHHRVSMPHMNASDIQEVAIEALVRFARNDFERWCEETGATPEDPRLFWSLAKRQINWRMADHMTLQNIDVSYDELTDPDSDYSTAWMRTKMVEPESLFQKQLVDLVDAMSLRERALFALYYFEELTQREIARVTLGITEATNSHQSDVSTRVARASARLLHAALNVTNGDALQPLSTKDAAWSPEHFDNWVKATYGSTATQYLQFVSICYGADVSYLVDMLNGTRRRNGAPTGAAATSVAAKASR